MSVMFETSLIRTRAPRADPSAVFADSCLSAAFDACADLRLLSYKRMCADEQTTKSDLPNLNHKLRRLSLYLRDLLICMGAGAQIKLCLMPAK